MAHPVADKSAFVPAHPFGSAQRSHTGGVLARHAGRAVPYKQLRYHDHRGFHRCYARGRLCHDAELHLRYGNDDLHRPEHRRRSFGSRGKGHKGRLKARPFRFRGTCCADPVLRPLSHGNVYEYAGRH